MSTGAKLKFSINEPSYASRKINRVLGEAFLKNLEMIKVPIYPILPGKGLGSSDIGNVSQIIPTIHPYLRISDKSIPGHSKQFAKASSTEKGHEAMINAAKALAMTAIDVLTNPDLFKAIKKEFESK